MVVNDKTDHCILLDIVCVNVIPFLIFSMFLGYEFHLCVFFKLAQFPPPRQSAHKLTA